MSAILPSSEALGRWLRRCVACAVATGWAGAWPEFRGPTGDGHADPADGVQVPSVWSESQNVRWKTPIPLRGWSTPVVQSGRVAVTTATADGHQFWALCLDAATGRIRWQRMIFSCANPEPLGNQLNSYASPSPLWLADRLIVHFGSYGTAALDPATGETLWQRTDLPCRHYRGPGSSPVAYGDLVILTMDGVDVQYLVALDARTGHTRWMARRTADWNDLGPDGRPVHEGDLRKAFSTPLIRPYEGRMQLWSVGAKAMYGYDPASGEELWKLAHPAYSAAARPVFDHGVLVICPGPGRCEMWGVRPGEKLRPAEILWRRTRRAPHIPSPILVGDRLVGVTDEGTLFCLDSRTGVEHWSVRLGGTFCASPVCLDGDRIVLGNVQGTVYVFRAARQYIGLSTNRLDAGLMASPAVADGALFLRTTSHLYRIEAGT